MTDVFYDRSSPFGYDQKGPFRDEKVLRYARSFHGRQPRRRVAGRKGLPRMTNKTLTKFMPVYATAMDRCILAAPT